MNATPTAFLEIEHKFVVDAEFDREVLFVACRALNQSVKALTVTDTYYVPPDSPTAFIASHRQGNPAADLEELAGQ